MAYPLPSPYDRRISRLRRRVQRPGQNPRAQDRLLGLRARRDVYRQRHTPPSPIPFNAQAESTVAGLRRDFGDTQASLAAQEFNTKTRYGFDAGFQGDPFSQARLLQDLHNQAQRGSLNSYASAGHLYSGSLSNARAANEQGYLRNVDTQQRAQQDALSRIQQARLAARRTLDEGVASAQAQGLEAALQESPDPSEVPTRSPAVKMYRGVLRKRLQSAQRRHKPRRVRQIRSRLRELSGKPSRRRNSPRKPTHE